MYSSIMLEYWYVLLLIVKSVSFVLGYMYKDDVTIQIAYEYSVAGSLSVCQWTE